MRYRANEIPFGSELCGLLPEIFSSGKGTILSVEKSERVGFSISRSGDKIKIEYSDLSHLATAIGDIVSGDFVESFVHPLEFRALMLDCSRNAVPKTSFLKDAIARLALMGMNYFCLYTEDTYEVDGEPLIGYARGAYSKDEIRELVAHAAKFGVTMFPCIQTLGHLEQILKYSHYQKICDNERVLNALVPETYEFVSKLISNASAPYDTKLIHLGMDETWGIGRGRTFKANTPINPRRIYAEHVAKVAKICDEKGLKPVIWGDFVLGSSGEEAMADEEISIIPRNVTLNYWNYYTPDERKYEVDFEKIEKSGFDCISSPGLWNWGNFLPDFKRVRENTSAMMKIVRRKKMRKVMMTMWGDDGHECPFDSCWLALSYFFATCRTPEPEQDFYKARAENICGADFAKFARFEKIGRNPANSPEGRMIPNPKMFFYEDPLYPACCLLPDKNDKALLKGLSKFYGAKSRGNKHYSRLYQMVSLFCEISAGKISLAQGLRKNYPGKRRKLKKSLSEAKKLARKVRKMHALYRRLWLEERKPFGLEEMDYRFAGLAARLDSCADTIRSFMKGKSHGIPELERNAPLELIKVHDTHTARKLRTKCLSLW